MEPSVGWIVAAFLLTAFVWAAALWAVLAAFKLRRAAQDLEARAADEAEEDSDIDWYELGALILPTLVEFQLARLGRAGRKEANMAEKRSSVFPWLLVGAGIGAAIGILFAPKKGAEVRKQVKDWIDEETELGKDLLEKGQLAGRELLAKGQERLLETKDQVVEAVKPRIAALRNGKKTAAKA